MSHQLGWNDAILGISLFYSCIDLNYEWELFETCQRPIHKWLLTSYACIVAFRLTHLLGTRCALAVARSEGGPSTLSVDFLLDLRQKGLLPRVLAAISWCLALPFFVVWTFLGTVWLLAVMRSTPSCVPSRTHLYFTSFWLALCYIWVLVHVALAVVAFLLERRVRIAERDLRAVEDDDVVSRWGEMSSLQSASSVIGGRSQGLTPEEINELPLDKAPVFTRPADCCRRGGSKPRMEAWQGMEIEGFGEHGNAQACECSICICEIEPGESIRRLPLCGHTFHRGCIDLWLLRRADCPLCKRQVKASDFNV